MTVLIKQSWAPTNRRWALYFSNNNPFTRILSYYQLQAMRVVTIWRFSTDLLCHPVCIVHLSCATFCQIKNLKVTYWAAMSQLKPVPQYLKKKIKKKFLLLPITVPRAPIPDAFWVSEPLSHPDEQPICSRKKTLLFKTSEISGCLWTATQRE